MSNLHLKYRPIQLEEVLGQDAVIKSLQGFVDGDKEWPHAFLFTGPSGVGKTTLARIIAYEVGCTQSHQIMEVDAASYSTKEQTKELVAAINFKSFGTDATKMIIIDECHALSTAAWQVLLKPLEEPPPHAFFALCTTEDKKVPRTIKTRCHCYTCKSLSTDDLVDLAQYIANQEDIDVRPVDITTIARASEGSARQVAVYLSQIQDLGSDHVRDIIDQSSDSSESIDLCRALIKGERDWGRLMKIVSSLQEQGVQPETVRIVILRYFTSVCIKPGKKDPPQLALAVIDSFSSPYHNTAEGWAPFILSLANLLYN